MGGARRQTCIWAGEGGVVWSAAVVRLCVVCSAAVLLSDVTAQHRRTLNTLVTVDLRCSISHSVIRSFSNNISRSISSSVSCSISLGIVTSISCISRRIGSGISKRSRDITHLSGPLDLRLGVPPQPVNSLPITAPPNDFTLSQGESSDITLRNTHIGNN